jgi:hypothetical protein
MYTGPCLVHFHIPRTRGTWLRQSLISRLSKYSQPDQIFFVNGSSEFGCMHGSYQDLCDLPRAALSRLRLVTGHLPPSVLDLLPDAFSFTILRDPVERCLSDYWFCHDDPTNPAHLFARTLSPVDFCRQGYGQARNGHARYLSGAVYATTPLSDDEVLRTASRNLKRLDLIGIDSQIDRFIKALGAVGLSGMEMNGSTNATKRLRPVTSEERELLKRENWIDYELYSDAQHPAASSSFIGCAVAVVMRHTAQRRKRRDVKLDD